MLEIEESDQSDVAFSFPMLHTPLVPTCVPIATSLAGCASDKARRHVNMDVVSVSGSNLTE